MDAGHRTDIRYIEKEVLFGYSTSFTKKKSPVVRPFFVRLQK
jgi:hypothetical protein